MEAIFLPAGPAQAPPPLPNPAGWSHKVTFQNINDFTLCNKYHLDMTWLVFLANQKTVSQVYFCMSFSLVSAN